MQYFKKGCAVVAKNKICLLCKIKVVIFHPIINTATEKPTIVVLRRLTWPKYSGAKNKELAPYILSVSYTHLIIVLVFIVCNCKR